MTSPKEWRTEAVFLLGGGTVACALLGTLLFALLHHFHVAGFLSETSPAALLIATLSFHGTVFLLSIPFLKYHQTSWSAVLGFDRPGLVPALGLAFMAFLLILPSVWGLQALSAAILHHFHYPIEDQVAIDLLLNVKSSLLRIYLILFATVLAPVAEEFIFRGVLYPWLRRYGHPALAWVVPSFLFALVHFSVPIFLPLFALALALTALYALTGRLLCTIVVHALFNAINVLLLFHNPAP